MKTLTRAVLLVGAPDNTPDIRYITRLSGVDPVIYLQGGRKWLLVPGLELNRAKRVARGVQVRSMEEAGGRIPARFSLAACIRELLRAEGIKSVGVAREFPAGLAQDLKRFGVHVTVESGRLFPGREVKTSWEISRIKRAQAVAVKAMRLAMRMIASSRVDGRGYLRYGGHVLSAGLLRRSVNIELLKNDCMGAGTIVACGRQSAEPHGRGSGPLRADTGIVIDIFPRSMEDGYWGDLTRTVVKGRASPALKKMYAAVKAAQAAALSRIKPGVRCATIHRAAVNEFARHGFHREVVDGLPQGFIHGTGHGIGVAVHEAPRIGIAPGRLKAGNVITIEPGLYYRDVGGVRIEDLVLVTGNGWRSLGVCAKMLEI